MNELNTDSLQIPQDNANAWQRSLIEKISLANQKEIKTARRWKIFFRLLSFLLAFLIFAAVMGWLDWSVPGQMTARGSHTALVKLDGEIDTEGKSSADAVIEGLRSAFKSPGTKGVILHCNTPGGSPVQAGRINTEIKRLRAENKDIPMVTVVDEMCASGGYYAAVASEKIFVDPASIVGSIGVIMDGFGATGAMEKFGIERRTITAGENKAMMDPFAPLNPKHKEYMQGLLNEVHQQFIKVVKDGRGGRLKAPENEVFSGLIYSGERAIALGLADAVGDVDSVARDVFKAEDVVDYSREDSTLDRFAKRIGASFGKSIGAASGLGGFKLQWR